MDHQVLTTYRPSALRVACVATCPPRQCGIATFSTDLATAMRDLDARLDLRFAAIEGAERHDYGADVAWRVVQGDPASYRALAHRLNTAAIDVILLQHEFGLFGNWGPTFDDHLAEFLSIVEAPVVSILHSVPPDPSESVRAAVQTLGRRSTHVIVMAEFAMGLLLERYGLDPDGLTMIPHGVPSPPQTSRACLRQALGVADRQLISTFGFLDPHKGLEHMIAAMSTVARRFPRAQYAIVGRTHPDLARRAGESYREQLQSEVDERGLQGNVTFVDEYVSLSRIVEYLAATDVYVTPYLDMNQVTSGTLAYALGQGRAVVSTPYVHAIEALRQGRGVLVPPSDPDALSTAVLDLLEHPARRRAMERRARAYGASMAWPLVGAQTLTALRSAAERAVSQPLRQTPTAQPALLSAQDTTWPVPVGAEHEELAAQVA